MLKLSKEAPEAPVTRRHSDAPIVRRENPSLAKNVAEADYDD